MERNIVLVDDQINQTKILRDYLTKMQYNVLILDNGIDLINALKRGGIITGLAADGSKDAGNSIPVNNIDLVMLDLDMPEMGGFEVMKEVKMIRSDLSVIILTAKNDQESIEKAFALGACNFIVKNDLDAYSKIYASVNNAIEQHILRQYIKNMEQMEGGQSTFSDILGRSPAIQKAINIAQKASDSDIPVLIQGENGTGKELFARSIHGTGKRADKPFIAVNCGAIPENLAESILFGHEKGAFTGAVYSAIGKFREADGGTLFLDEVGELKPDMQVKLLRALQEKEVEPVGAKGAVKVNIRVIAATNRDLEKEVADGRFREDLYYRLSVFPIYIPSLREREEDISFLLNNFCYSTSIKENKKISGISPEATKMLEEYAWPGNIRQLKNAVFRAVVLCEGDYLDVEDFPQIANIVSHVKSIKSESDEYSEMSIRITNKLNKLRSMSEIESEIIEKAMNFYDGNVSRVANRLGIGRATLYRKLKGEDSLDEEDNGEE